MSQTNSVVVHGNLTHEPTIKNFNGRSFCSFQIACSRSWEDKEGTEQKHTDFLPITAWGTTADSILEQAIARGSLVAIEGNLRSSHYEKNGQRQTRIFVSARSISNILRKEPDVPATTSIPPVEELDPNDLPF